MTAVAITCDGCGKAHDGGRWWMLTRNVDLQHERYDLCERCGERQLNPCRRKLTTGVVATSGP